MSSKSANIANRSLWTVQVLLALLFLFAGSMKFIMSPEQMQQGPIVLPLAFIRFIGICECLGALGLVLPGAARTWTVLTPLAATGLTIIMIGAVVITVMSAGISAAAFPFVVCVSTAAISIGRSRIAPLADSTHRVLRTV